MSVLQFWYEFASTYSYPAAMRVEEAPARYGVSISWQPFLLGPIFKGHGWDTSPFNLHADKGRYMWRDLERICAGLDLPPMRRPDPFPQNPLKAARIALSLPDGQARSQFSKAVYAAEFAWLLPIDDDNVLRDILIGLSLPADELIATSQVETTKQALKSQVATAQNLGIFGAPAFVASDGELFWGNDRLDDALKWQARL
ncbi:MAG: 2-hydroxychromene-2-carboxylate isomerase [Alphaproteobacteria bacterium]|nr:2-hydroxychromene-2-carboxylate isomerase [Alphaproteobacteria bacterium]